MNTEYANETACGFAMITEKVGSKLPAPYFTLCYLNSFLNWAIKSTISKAAVAQSTPLLPMRFSA